MHNISIKHKIVYTTKVAAIENSVKAERQDADLNLHFWSVRSGIMASPISMNNIRSIQTGQNAGLSTTMAA